MLGQLRKKHFERSAFFNDVCLRQMMLASPMMTASPNDVWLRHMLLQTSHHCERSEQHHYAKRNFIWRSQTSLNSRVAIPSYEDKDPRSEERGSFIYAAGTTSFDRRHNIIFHLYGRKGTRLRQWNKCSIDKYTTFYVSVAL